MTDKNTPYFRRKLICMKPFVPCPWDLFNMLLSNSIAKIYAVNSRRVFENLRKIWIHVYKHRIQFVQFPPAVNHQFKTYIEGIIFYLLAVLFCLFVAFTYRKINFNLHVMYLKIVYSPIEENG